MIPHTGVYIMLKSRVLGGSTGWVLGVQASPWIQFFFYSNSVSKLPRTMESNFLPVLLVKNWSEHISSRFLFLSSIKIRTFRPMRNTIKCGSGIQCVIFTSTNSTVALFHSAKYIFWGVPLLLVLCFCRRTYNHLQAERNSRVIVAAFFGGFWCTTASCRGGARFYQWYE